ncbi:MAG: sodium:proton antiporter [Dehalococcoidia bacterium]|nr:sodium:proton antiporter [Dehalococcoidia bacterium]
MGRVHGMRAPPRGPRRGPRPICYRWDSSPPHDGEEATPQRPRTVERRIVDNTTLLVNLVFAFAVAGTGAAIAALLRQSVILGYIVAGVLLGPYTPGYVADSGTVDALAEVGIILLLFSVGIQLSLRDLARVGRIAVFGGLSQVIVSIALGAGLALLAGWGEIEALFFGAVVSNSSSTVLSKVLGDRGEAGSVHGQIGLAWSSVQDVSTIFLVVILTTLHSGDGNLWADLLIEGGRAVLFLALLIPVGSRLLPHVFDRISALDNREVFVFSAATMALGTAYVATLFGLSPALGAFVAGIVLSESDVRHEVLRELLPLRDLFAGLFFVSVGMLVDLEFVVTNPIPVLMTVFMVIPAKGLMSMVITWIFRYPARTALLTGVTLAQSAEFSFLMARVGADIGALGADTFSTILAGTVISVVFAPALQDLARAPGRWLEAQFPARIDGGPVGSMERRATFRNHAVICGYGRVGRVIGAALARQGVPFIVIDHDRYRVRELREAGVPALLGSADNVTLLRETHLDEARLLVVAIPESLATRRIVDFALRQNPDLGIVARTHSASERDALEAQGVSEAVLGELELAIEMSRYALRRFGLDIASVEETVSEFRNRHDHRESAADGAREAGHEARLDASHTLWEAPEAVREGTEPRSVN